MRLFLKFSPLFVILCLVLAVLLSFTVIAGPSAATFKPRSPNNEQDPVYYRFGPDLKFQHNLARPEARAGAYTTQTYEGIRDFRQSQSVARYLDTLCGALNFAIRLRLNDFTDLGISGCDLTTKLMQQYVNAQAPVPKG